MKVFLERGENTIEQIIEISKKVVDIPGVEIFKQENPVETEQYNLTLK